MKPLSTSVIISTYNGEKKIAGILNALLLQSFRNFEVLVVIDGSTDNTYSVVKNYELKFSNLRIVTQENKGRAGVKNTGAKESSGDILIFYDDDMAPYSDSIEKHIAFHTKFSGIMSGNPVEIIDSARTDIQNYKAALTDKWTKKYTDGITQLDASNLFFTAANCSVTKEVFFALSGFNSLLTDAEDHDFAFRALQNNIPVFFDKSNKAIHRESITARSYITRLRHYREAHQKLFEIHPDRKSNQRANVLKRRIYRLIARPYLVKLIDREFFRWIMPKSVRYKLYDLVIQALAIEYPTKPL